MKFLSKTIVTLLAMLLLAGITQTNTHAASGSIITQIGIVEASSLRLRSAPSTNSKTIKYSYDGDYVLITGRTGSWYHVRYNLTEGYMHADFLSVHDAKNVELGYGLLNANKVNLRSGPGTSHGILRQTQSGEQAYIIGFNRQWYKVIIGSHIGYIRSDYLDLTQIPYENTGSTNQPRFYIDGKSTGIPPSPSALKNPSGSLRDNIVANANKLLGTPYLWGGSSPTGFDCSGFTQYVLKQSGIHLPRTTELQVQQGTYIDKNQLQKGDLVFLKDTYRSGVSHVGIYIGEGKMIHASSSKGVTISDLSTSYYVKHYHSARRII